MPWRRVEEDGEPRYGCGCLIAILVTDFLLFGLPIFLLSCGR